MVVCQCSSNKQFALQLYFRISLIRYSQFGRASLSQISQAFSLVVAVS
jgi:hypothetical protein